MPMSEEVSLSRRRLLRRLALGASAASLAAGALRTTRAASAPLLSVHAPEAKAVNLSATGVFIETSNLGLRKGQHVVLSFAINLGGVTKLHRRTAVVAHVSRGGTGLMMESFAQSSS